MMVTRDVQEVTQVGNRSYVSVGRLRSNGDIISLRQEYVNRKGEPAQGFCVLLSSPSRRCAPSSGAHHALYRTTSSSCNSARHLHQPPANPHRRVCPGRRSAPSAGHPLSPACHPDARRRRHLVNHHSLLAMAEWGAAQSSAIKQVRGFPTERTRHVSTLQRLFRRLDPTSLEAALTTVFDLRPWQSAAGPVAL